MNVERDTILSDVAWTAYELWIKGWHEANGGNLTLCLSPEQVAQIVKPGCASDWTAISNHPLPVLAKARFLCTAAGSRFRTLHRAAERWMGVIEMDDTGARYRTLWGFSEGERPTSELPVHMQIHAALGGPLGVVIHSHPTHLAAMSCLMEPNSNELTRLLWAMHGECVAFFPKGIEFLPFRMSGSEEAGRIAADALQRRDMLLWQFHGIFTAGKDLETVFSRIEAAEKAAEVYLKVAAAGGPRFRLSLERAREIAQAVGVKPDAEILAG